MTATDAGRRTGEPATAAEIAQQPALWRALAADLAARRGAVDAALSPWLERPDVRVVLTGAGTSAYAGGVLAPVLSRSLRRRVEAVATTDVVADPRGVLAHDVPTLLVSFARSGDSPESVAATDLADACLREVGHLVVTCNPDGQLARRHGERPGSLVLHMPPGSNDRGFAMTSSFTCMLLAAWSALDPHPPSTDLVDALAGAARDVLAERGRDLAALAGAGYERVVHLGSGSLAALAQEASLKLLELTAGGVVALAESSLGFRHGPKAVLRPGTLAVVHSSGDPYTGAYDDDIAAELAASLGDEHVLVLAGHERPAAHAGPTWRLPGLAGAPDVALALPYAVVAQTLALRWSLARGLAPDNPFPGGDVNRVVQGVTIHPLPPER